MALKMADPVTIFDLGGTAFAIKPTIEMVVNYPLEFQYEPNDVTPLSREPGGLHDTMYIPAHGPVWGRRYPRRAYKNLIAASRYW